MTPNQVDLVQMSFERVRPIREAAAALFYQRLFELNPKLRGLFRRDLEEQGRMLMQVLSVAVAELDRVAALVPTLRELGRKHAGYGVAHDDYDTVGTALLWTLQQGLGASFTGEVCEAWTEAYAALAGSMQEGARTALMQAA